MKPKYLQDLIKNLQELYKCPSCTTNYRFEDVRFLGEVEKHYLVQLKCPKCSLPVLAHVSVDVKSPGKSGLRTDLCRGESAKFKAKGAITASEIAEFYGRISTSKRLID